MNDLVCHMTLTLCSAAIVIRKHRATSCHNKTSVKISKEGYLSGGRSVL